MEVSDSNVIRQHLKIHPNYLYTKILRTNWTCTYNLYSEGISDLRPFQADAIPEIQNKFWFWGRKYAVDIRYFTAFWLLIITHARVVWSGLCSDKMDRFLFLVTIRYGPYHSILKYSRMRKWNSETFDLARTVNISKVTSMLVTDLKHWKIYITTKKSPT